MPLRALHVGARKFAYDLIEYREQQGFLGRRRVIGGVPFATELTRGLSWNA